jgi:hypothetical protein
MSGHVVKKNRKGARRRLRGGFVWRVGGGRHDDIPCKQEEGALSAKPRKEACLTKKNLRF